MADEFSPIFVFPVKQIQAQSCQAITRAPRRPAQGGVALTFVSTSCLGRKLYRIRSKWGILPHRGRHTRNLGYVWVRDSLRPLRQLFLSQDQAFPVLGLQKETAQTWLQRQATFQQRAKWLLEFLREVWLQGHGVCSHQSLIKAREAELVTSLL